jgi:hypothetical protein
MSQDQNIGTQPTQQGKPATNKRTNRNGRNRPILVTDDATDQMSGSEARETASAPITTVPTATQEAPPVKGRPSFFSTIGKKEETADVAAARLARATRNKVAAPVKKESKEVEETKKSDSKAVAKSAPTRSGGNAASAPRRGGFKPRHLIGILAYLVVADVVGVYEKSWLVSAHLEKLLITLGPLPIYNSTIVFLLTLVILLVLLARFDLVPRSLTPAPRQPVTTNKGRPQDNADTDSDTTRNTPNIKQGVKGTNDDLYQEYRETQRYWQRRDRKK